MSTQNACIRPIKIIYAQLGTLCIELHPVSRSSLFGFQTKSNISFMYFPQNYQICAAYKMSLFGNRE